MSNQNEHNSFYGIIAITILLCFITGIAELFFAFDMYLGNQFIATAITLCAATVNFCAMLYILIKK